MKKRWLFIAVLFPLLSLAQGNDSGMGIVTISSVGLATGESAAKPLYQLSAGFTFDRWFAGAGAGYDQYKFNSFPVFTDWRMSFGRTRLAFLYANVGYNFAGKGNENEYAIQMFKTSDRFTGGFYMDAGAGYRIKLGTWHRLLFSAGYSRKHMENRIGITVPCWNPPCTEEQYTYRFALGRITAKLSWELGKLNSK